MVLLLAVIVIALGLIYVAIRVNPSLDSKMCPSDNMIAEEVLLILDSTDPWSAVRRTALANDMEQIRGSIARFARLHVYVVEAADQAPGQALGEVNTSPALVLCNPGSAGQVRNSTSKWLSWLVTNPNRLSERWDTEFAAAIDSILAEAGRAPAQASSPIMETLRAAALAVGTERHLRVIIMSDMYQNSSHFSLYGEAGLSGVSPESLADVTALGTRALQGAAVQLYLLTPAQGEFIPRNELVLFWERYLRAQGASVESIRRVEQ